MPAIADLDECLDLVFKGLQQHTMPLHIKIRHVADKEIVEVRDAYDFPKAATRVRVRRGCFRHAVAAFIGTSKKSARTDCSSQLILGENVKARVVIREFRNRKAVSLSHRIRLPVESAVHIRKNSVSGL